AAWPAAVNVIADSDGRVRRYPYAVDLGTQSVRSLPAVLAGRQVEQESRFLIDFSLDATQIDRIAYIDVLERRIDLARLAGKQVIVGAGAVELADNFAVPRYGVLTGPMTQALATETLLQGRELTVVGPWLAFEFLIALGVFFVLCMKKLTPPSLVAGMAIGALVTEAIAIHVMGEWHLVFNTAAVHIGSFAMLQGFVISEWDLRGLLMRRTRKQYVATRAVLDRVIADHFDAVVVVNGAGEIVATSRPADEMLGAGQSLVGNRAATVLPSALADPVAAALNPGAGEVSARDTPVETTLRHTRKGGGDIIIEYVVTASDVPASEEDMAPTAPSRVVCLTFRDITERTARQRQIKYVADH
ncbi:MAG: CHASE2 domain-containing protein, partial [Cucumibacter sp.]